MKFRKVPKPNRVSFTLSDEANDFLNSYSLNTGIPKSVLVDVWIIQQMKIQNAFLEKITNDNSD